MPTSNLLDQAQTNISPLPIINLSEFLESNARRPNYWMRPANDRHSQQMVGAYINAAKDDLKNGGYIFVKKSRAADVFRQLTEAGAQYKAVNFKDMTDIDDILCFEDPKALWVIVEDDSLPLEVLASRFKIAQVALRRQMAPLLGTPMTIKEILQTPERRGFIHLMFVEMNFPAIKGFAVIAAQCRSLRIAHCTVSRLSSHDHEVTKLFDEPQHNSDELKGMLANTIRVLGSGPKHRAENTDSFQHWFSYQARNANSQQVGESHPELLQVEMERLEHESNLGVAFGFGDAHIVNLAR